MVSETKKKTIISNQVLLLTNFIIKVIWLNTVEQSKRTGEVLRICREAGVMTGLPVVWMR